MHSLRAPTLARRPSIRFTTEVGPGVPSPKPVVYLAVRQTRIVSGLGACVVSNLMRRAW